ncbi:hypothetical protein FNV43_RR04597 [Rhamnella rubrinervis]|uniref:Uncharacterized protein n=1 Tax=Rhamnella rubrinervis TaxID=2594499 RepID=A0A8K0HKK4_9ROSA|nr:hypothetical protein FNV43_RR04597 [Rhamnella rubrinervis]
MTTIEPRSGLIAVEKLDSELEKIFLTDVLETKVIYDSFMWKEGVGYREVKKDNTIVVAVGLATKLARKAISLDCGLNVATPSVRSMFASSLLDDYVVCLNNVTPHADLIILELLNFDVILVWYYLVRACIDCKENKVRLAP